MRTALVLAASFVLFACAAESAPSADGAPDEEDYTKVSPYAGAFNDFGGSASRAQGSVFTLSIRTDGTFTMAVEGIYGCSNFKGSGYQGYSCPSSWSDGMAGWTEVSGTWKAVSGGVELQPKSDIGKPSDPFVLALSVKGDKLDLSGEIPPHRPIKGKLDVQALCAKPHTVKDKALDGTWLVDSPLDKDGDQPLLSGSMMYVKGMQHLVKFDSKAHTYSEWRSDAKPRSIHAVGPWGVGGAPDGKGLGVVVLDGEGSLFDNVTIEKLAGDKLTLGIVGDRRITLTRQP
jgi:hypothetical protein